MRITLQLIALVLILSACQNAKKSKSTLDNKDITKYEENFESLAKHADAPQWFRDAKFGIYFHWGVYSVAEFKDEWYPRRIFQKEDPCHQFHKKTYGEPKDVGYHTLVPKFTAEFFDGEDWAELFKKAGAKFAGPVAEHHDGFAMWDSKATPWNAKDKGPKKDITGELSKAIKGQGMKLITTFHHARHLQRYTKTFQEEMDSDKESKRKFGLSHYSFFPEYQEMMSKEPYNYLYGVIPENQWLEDIWFGKLKEVIDQYQPDIIWFDTWLDKIPEEYRAKFAAYYFNEAEKLDKDVVIVRKQDDLPLSFSVDDLERSRKNKIEELVWMTDEAISPTSWCYTQGLEVKKAEDIIHVLVDIVSKNGVLLLNISPKFDGSIPQDQRETLLGIGDWLTENGEAIYGSKTWYTFGEGPTKEPEGHFKNHKAFQHIKYSAADFRFTVNKGFIYAIQLGVDKPGTERTLVSFAGEEYKVKNVTALGGNENVKWQQTNDGLKITASENEIKHALVYKIELDK